MTLARPILAVAPVAYVLIEDRLKVFRNLEKHLEPSRTSAETLADGLIETYPWGDHATLFSAAGDEETPVSLSEKRTTFALRQPLGGGDRLLLRRITSNATAAATAATAAPT